jgi:hypothetical protein
MDYKTRSCSGPIPDYCTPEHDYGGCWRGTFGGQPFHACADNIRTYRYLAQSGALNATSQPFRCECPPCFRAAPSGGCEPSCDLELCSEALGACLSNGAAGGGGRGSTGGGASVRGGVLGVGWAGAPSRSGAGEGSLVECRASPGPAAPARHARFLTAVTYVEIGAPPTTPKRTPGPSSPPTPPTPEQAASASWACSRPCCARPPSRRAAFTRPTPPC